MGRAVTGWVQEAPANNSCARGSQTWGCPCSALSFPRSVFPFHQVQLQNTAQASPRPGTDLPACTVASAPPPQPIAPTCRPQVRCPVSITPSHCPGSPQTITQAPPLQPVNPIHHPDPFPWPQTISMAPPRQPIIPIRCPGSIIPAHPTHHPSSITGPGHPHPTAVPTPRQPAAGTSLPAASILRGHKSS